MKVNIQNHTFDIVINIGSIKRVKAATGVDLLLDETDSDKLVNMLADPMQIAEIIAALLEPQFEENGIDADKVYDLFDGEALKQVSDAFYEELKAFFKGLNRPGVVLAIEKMLQALNLAHQEIANKIQKFDIPKIVRSGMASTKRRG